MSDLPDESMSTTTSERILYSSLACISIDERTEKEKAMFQAIEEGLLSGQLLDDGMNMNVTNKHGYTALQHACWRQQLDACRLLLKHGADVNSTQHPHNYSALMIATICGNADITRLLLQHGANASHKNPIGKTCAEMAAFTSQHDIELVVLAHYPRDFIADYATSDDNGERPTLSSELVDQLHDFTMITNLHPVKLSLVLRTRRPLLESAGPGAAVLQHLSEQLLQRDATHERLAFRLHYFSRLLQQVHDWSQKNNDPDLELWIKYLVRGRESDGFAERSERLARSTIKDRESQETPLLLEIAQQVASVPLGRTPTAVSVLQHFLIGQQQVTGIEEFVCDTCGADHASKRCTKCKAVHYCAVECQKYHWTTHKKHCDRMKVEKERRDIEVAKQHTKNKESFAAELQS